MPNYDESLYKRDILLKFIDERVFSAESKRRKNKIYMNICKFFNLALNAMSLIFISIITTKLTSHVMFDFLAMAFTILSTFSINLEKRFGFSKRFHQNLITSAKLRTLKTELLIELVENDEDEIIKKYMNFTKEILKNQSQEFKENLIRAEKNANQNHIS